jgi:hypothetical protein
MGVWSWLFGGDAAPATMDINPATGLPMLGDCGGVDVGGNPFGMDVHQTGGHSLPGVESGLDEGAGFGCEWPN